MIRVRSIRVPRDWKTASAWQRGFVCVACVVAVLAVWTLVAAAQQQNPAPPPAPQAQGSQAPPVTFKVEVNYVEVDAVVVDKQGSFVRDLKRDDFQVLENGKPEKIATFSFVNIPVERVEKPLFVKQPIEPDV